MQGRLMLPWKPSSRRPAASTAARCGCWRRRSVRGSIRHPCHATSSQVQSHPHDHGHAALHDAHHASRGACLPDDAQRPKAENMGACCCMCMVDRVLRCSGSARRPGLNGPLHVAAGQEKRMLPALCTQPPLYRCLYLMPLICQNKSKLPVPCTHPAHTSAPTKCHSSAPAGSTRASSPHPAYRLHCTNAST